METSSLNTLGIKAETCGTRSRTNGQFRYRFLRWSAKAHELCAHFSRLQQFKGIQLLLEIVTVHFISSPMPIVSEPVCVEPAPEAQLDSSKVWFCKKAFQGLKISPQTWCIHSTQKINDMNYNQLISDPSTYVKKRARRSDDSILLCHIDDVVGAGPEEYLMSDF